MRPDSHGAGPGSGWQAQLDGELASDSAGSYQYVVSRLEGQRTASAAPMPAPAGFSMPSPGDVAVAAGIAQRMEDGTVVFQFAPEGGGDTPPAASEPARSSEMPPAQRVEATAAPPSAAGPAPGAGASSGDLDDLARRLYPKIRPYLKKELWLDRERAGLLMDSGR